MLSEDFSDQKVLWFRLTNCHGFNRASHFEEKDGSFMDKYRVGVGK